MSNNGTVPQVQGYYEGVKNWTSNGYSVYESGRNKVEEYARRKLSPENGHLAARITNCVSEILIDLCALTGVFVLPAAIVYTIKRAIPLTKYVMACFKKDANPETKKAAKEAMKKEYIDSLHTTIGPALLVALAVHTVFWLSFGLLALNGAILFKTIVVSLPACLFLYELLTAKRGRAEPPQPDVERPFPLDQQQLQSVGASPLAQQEMSVFPSAVAIPGASAPMEEQT